MTDRDLTSAEWAAISRALEWAEQQRTSRLCYQMTSYLARELSWSQESGYFVGLGLRVGHYWNRLPDGTIIDPTYDQFDEDRADPVRIVPPGSPGQADYARG